jgi:hypothetical protein
LKEEKGCGHAQDGNHDDPSNRHRWKLPHPLIPNEWDAYGLAEKLRAGAIDKKIFKAAQEFTLLRELSRAHITATRDLVRVQSRPKSLYRSRGIQAPGASVYSLRHRDDWERRLPASAPGRALRLLELIV